MDQELRTQMCRLIAGLVVADDDLQPAEEAFLDRVLAQFDIPEEERDSIFPIVDRSEAAVTIRELPESAQKAALELLIDAAMADGMVAPEERAYLDAVATEMGVSAGDLERQIDVRRPVVIG